MAEYYSLDEQQRRHPSVLRLLCLFESEISGEDYIGEPVSILEHALQAANEATKFFQSSASSNVNHVLTYEQEEVVIASLLHDIGHLIGLEAGDSNEKMGDVASWIMKELVDSLYPLWDFLIESLNLLPIMSWRKDIYASRILSTFQFFQKHLAPHFLIKGDP